MNVLRCDTKDDLKWGLRHIFFRESESTTYGEHTSFDFEEIAEILQVDITIHEMNKTDVNWFDWDDSLNMDWLEEQIFMCDNTPYLSDFKPGVLIWLMDDDFDRIGHVITRVFQYTTNDEMSITAVKKEVNDALVEAEKINAEWAEYRRKIIEVESQLS